MRKQFLKDLISDLLPYILMFAFVFACGKLLAGNPRLNPATPKTRDGALVWDDDITWHKKIQTGSDSVYTFQTESAVIVGASDTLYSDCFRNKDVISLQPILSGGTTVSIYVVIQTANSGTNHPAIMPDSLFKDTYWLVKGTGIANCYAKTSSSVFAENTVQTVPINVPALGCGLFRILVYSSGTQSGNTSIRIPAILKEE